MKLGYPKEAIEQQLALVRRNISEKISDIRKRGPQTEVSIVLKLITFSAAVVRDCRSKARFSVFGIYTAVPCFVLEHLQIMKIPPLI